MLESHTVAASVKTAVADAVHDLVEVGLTPTEARAYATLLAVPRARAAEVAVRADVPRQKVYEALRSLEEHGFCLAEVGRVVEYRAVPADRALPGWIRERERKRRLLAEREERLAERLARTLPVPPAGDAGEEDAGMETVVGPARTSEVLDRMAAAAQRSLDIIQPPPFLQPRSRWNVGEVAAVMRGVRVRVLNTPEGLEDPERALALLRAGGSVRALGGLALKMILRDGVEAALALADPVTGRQRIMSAVIRHPALVEPLQALFEGEWKKGRPVTLAADGNVAIADD